MDNKKFQDWIATEDWRADYNKIKVIQKKHYAGSAVSQALASPTEENIKTGFGYLSDFINSLTAMSKDPEDELKDLRKRLSEIIKVVHGNPEHEEVQKLYKKYGVYRETKKTGIYTRTDLINVFLLAEELNKIYVRGSYTAQKLGFGSSIPFEQKSPFDKL